MHAIASPVQEGGLDEDGDVRVAMLNAFGIVADASSSSSSLKTDDAPRTLAEWDAAFRCAMERKTKNQAYFTEREADLSTFLGMPDGCPVTSAVSVPHELVDLEERIGCLPDRLSEASRMPIKWVPACTRRDGGALDLSGEWRRGW